MWPNMNLVAAAVKSGKTKKGRTYPPGPEIQFSCREKEDSYNTPLVVKFGTTKNADFRVGIA